jgi:hypothetical protein
LIPFSLPSRRSLWVIRVFSTSEARVSRVKSLPARLPSLGHRFALLFSAQWQDQYCGCSFSRVADPLTHHLLVMGCHFHQPGYPCPHV